jgi:hypothetical protein
MCHREQPNTDKFFQPLKGSGLSAECRECLKARYRKFSQARKAIKQAEPKDRRRLRAEMKAAAAAAARRRSHINHDGTKQCIGCKNSFPAMGKFFYIYKTTGHMDGRCKSCRRDYNKARYGERYARMQSQAPREGKKPCSRCGKRKLLTEFPKTGAICKACKKVYHDQWWQKANARVCWKCRESKPPREMQPFQYRNICRDCFAARTSKRCRTCGKYKPLMREFWPLGTGTADGFRAECTECRAAYDAAKYESQRSDPLYRERKAKNAKGWRARNLEYAQRRDKKYNAKPEVKQRRQERDAERRATDPEFVEQNKRRSREWHQENRDRILEEGRELRAARRLTNGDGRKRPRNRTVLKYATEIWQPHKTP